MHSLRELQDSFQRHLFCGDKGIIRHIVNTQNASDTQRLATYRNAYYGRLVEALSTDFTAVNAALGDDNFSRLCHDYIDIHPSIHYSLRCFGQQFPEFIQRHAISQQHAYLAELATLEWIFVNAFDASDETPLAASCVTDVPAASWPDIRIRLHPSVYYLNYHWNILDIWRAARDQEPLMHAEELAQTSTCLIWRHDLTTRYRILGSAEATALHAAALGATFAQICERLAENIETASVDFNQIAIQSAGMLKTWLADDLIIDVTTG
jgi:hypothetical protein